jgi:hypothetical protein
LRDTAAIGRILRTRLRAQTESPRTVIGYLIADELDHDAALVERLQKLAREDIFAQSWEVLLDQAQAAWRDLFGLLRQGAANDPRLQDLSLGTSGPAPSTKGGGGAK